MEKFRLAIFSTQPPHIYVGGVERRIIETTKRLQNQADITVISGTKAGFKEPTTINNVKFIPYYSTDKIFPLDNWFFNRSIAKKAANINADVFEAHVVSGYGLLKALSSQGIKKPFIHTIHGVLADEYEQAKKNGYQSFRNSAVNYFMAKLAKLESETAQNSTLIVTISNYSLEKMKQFYNVDEAKVRIVPNGVDVAKFRPSTDKEEIRKQFGLGDEPCVLFVGSLIPRKGLHYLVEVAKKIVNEHSETTFLIVGEGPLKNQLVNSLETANISKNFKFLGNLKDDKLPDLYNCADVFVLPSIQEGQGIVLLEAQACGKPIVAFDIGGVNEAVRNGETGLLVKLGDTEEFANALLKLIGDKGLQEKMGADGRKYVLEKYTWDICAQKMLKVYYEALEN
jgi:glycogen(starch) synthase